MKLINIIKLVALVGLISVCATSTYAQKKIRPVAQALSEVELLQRVEQFVGKTARFPRAYVPANVQRSSSVLQEEQLARAVNRSLQQARTHTPAILRLKELRDSFKQVEWEENIVEELKSFVAQNGRWPRTNIRTVRGTLNRVEDMTPEQVAEFKLAKQIELIQVKGPHADNARKIQEIKGQLDESTSQ